MKPVSKEFISFINVRTYIGINVEVLVANNVDVLHMWHILGRMIRTGLEKETEKKW